MKNKFIVLLSAVTAAMLLSSCGSQDGAVSSETTSEVLSETSAEESAVSDTESVSETEASEDTVQTVSAEEVVEEGMVPIYGSDIKDGTYDVTVDSSSSMFNITKCALTVSDGKMTAEMTMGGKG